MNTIPSIFNETITPYTAVGGKERIASSGISAVILNRTGLIRRSFFQDIEKTGFDNIISIESSAPLYDIEELASRFPFVRFILPERDINLGEQINIGAAEVESPLFFVIKSDMKIVAGGTARRMAERLSAISGKESDTSSILITGEKGTAFKRLCTVPVFVNPNYEVFPSLVAPATFKRKMRPVFTVPETESGTSGGTESLLTLYPFDGVGIYDKMRFIHLGGYDVTLKETHWQLLDFGFRAHLWGEEIKLNHNFKLLYDGEFPAEDSSIDDSYRRFYLKNLAPAFRNDYAHLPLVRFPSFLFNSGEDIFSAWNEFKECRRWVKKNKFRWRLDARAVTNKWKTSDD